MLLVDAYNALHVQGVLPPELAGIEPPALAQLLAATDLAPRGATLVCDGPPPLSRRPAGRLLDRDARRVLHVEGAEGVKIVYAGAGRDADSLIERLIETSDAPRQLLVVSTDHRIRLAARRRRARWLRSEDFLRRLVEALHADHRGRGAPGHGRSLSGLVKPDAPLRDDEVRSWLDEFGFDPSIADEPARTSDTATPRPGETDADAAPNRQAAPDDDPLLRDAMEEWRGRLDWDDLDMRRWLDTPDQPDDQPPS
jgi:hypothetical protein